MQKLFIVFTALLVVLTVPVLSLTPVAVGATYECSDNQDNDFDGFVDLADTGCTSLTDNSEINPSSSNNNNNQNNQNQNTNQQVVVYQCSDGLDNDFDGFFDSNDSDCTSTTDNSEQPSRNQPAQNQPPVCSNVNSFYSVQTNQTISFDLNATDPNGDSLTYTIFGRPAGANFDSNSGFFSWTPTTSQGGLYSLTVRASDPSGAYCERVIEIEVRSTVNPTGNRAPVCSNLDSFYSIRVNQELSFDVDTTDPDGDSLTYSIFNRPAGASFNTASGFFRFTPNFNQRGTHFPIFRATDPSGAYCERAVEIEVNDNNIIPIRNNRPPFFTTTPVTSAVEGQIYVYDANAFDPDFDPLTFALVSGPAGMSVNPFSGLVQWTPNFNQGGSSYVVTISVTDGRYAPVRQTYTIFVQNQGLTPLPQPSPTVPLTITALRIENEGLLPVVAGAVTAVNQCACQPYGNYTYGTYGTTYTSNQYGYTTNYAAQFAGQRGANVIVTFETSRPTRAFVAYSLVPHGPDAKAADYEYRTPDSAVISTIHRFNLGPLEVGRTYYIQAFATADSKTVKSGEQGFLQLVGATLQPTSPEQNGNGQDGLVGAASVLSALGAFLFNPWFLLLVIIGLLFALILRRRRETVVTTPIDIKIPKTS